MTDFEQQADGPMDAEQEAMARALTEAQLKRIDEALLAQTTHQWSKVARVIGYAMRDLRSEFPDLPDVFYAIRVKHLAATGKIEAAGNLDRMRFSEVRLAAEQKPPSAER